MARSALSRSVMAVIVVALLVTASCGNDEADVASPTTTEPPGALDFSERGPYAVGVTELEVDSEHPVLVFYPVDRGDVPAGVRPFEYTAEDTWGPLASVLSPASLEVNHFVVSDAWRDLPSSADDPFPVLVLSHSLATTRFSFSFHAAHVASWGFVVAAPQHPSRDLLAELTGQTNMIADVATIADAIDVVGAEAERPGSALEGRVAVDAVAVEGHSSGGRDGILAAYGDEVDAWIALAAAVPVPDDATDGHDVIREGWHGFEPAIGEFDLVAWLDATAAPPGKPSLTIVADNDLLFPPEQQRAIYDWLSAPKRFVVLEDTGHMVFTDGCAGLQQRGGLSDEFVESVGKDPSSDEIQAVQDGCLPEDAPVDAVTAVWNHFVVAHLRSAFGVDPPTAAASLDLDFINESFPGRVELYVAE